MVIVDYLRLISATLLGATVGLAAYACYLAFGDAGQALSDSLEETI